MGTVRIGFDARAAFVDPHRGFGRVTRSLADALLELLPGEIVLFVPHGVRTPERWYRLAAAIVHLRRPRRGAFVVDGPAWVWTSRRRRVDALHLPTWGVPPGIGVPVVATFYDAIPFRFPSPPRRWARARARMAIRSMRRAAAVHAISSFARDELLATVSIPASRVVAVPLAVGAPFTPKAGAAPRHLLFVGGADPHKNLPLLLSMMADPRAGALPPLVVAGPAASDGPLRAAIESAGLSDRVVVHPPESDEGLAELYRHALALLMPSLSEGFGLPALEAMACGCPVLAAGTGSLPEVCGDAARLLEPTDADAWLDSIAALAASSSARAEMVEAGLARAARFTWERTARGVAAIYRGL
ncbi:MAG: glycosyltransferase family 1 protein [Acidobacteriota bacterium]